MSLNSLLSAIKSQNVQKRQDALLELRKRSKSGDDITELYDLECGEMLLDLLEEENGKYYTVILSIFANCTNINENWRQLVSFILEAIFFFKFGQTWIYILFFATQYSFSN